MFMLPQQQGGNGLINYVMQQPSASQISGYPGLMNGFMTGYSYDPFGGGGMSKQPSSQQPYGVDSLLSSLSPKYRKANALYGAGKSLWNGQYSDAAAGMLGQGQQSGLFEDLGGMFGGSSGGGSILSSGDDGSIIGGLLSLFGV